MTTASRSGYRCADSARIEARDRPICDALPFVAACGPAGKTGALARPGRTTVGLVIRSTCGARRWLRRPTRSAAARRRPATFVNGTLLPHDGLRRVRTCCGAGGRAVEAAGLHGQ